MRIQPIDGVGSMDEVTRRILSALGIKDGDGKNLEPVS
jgi:hypothetical protein